MPLHVAASQRDNDCEEPDDTNRYLQNAAMLQRIAVCRVELK
jgi:hypothetical protein